MNIVTDPALLSELEGTGQNNPVSDPNLVNQLESSTPQPEPVQPSHTFEILMNNVDAVESDKIKKSMFLSDIMNTSASRIGSPVKTDTDHVYTNYDTYTNELQKQGIDANKPGSMLGDVWSNFTDFLTQPSSETTPRMQRGQERNVGAVETGASLATMLPGVVGGISAVVGRLEGIALHGDTFSWTGIEEAFIKGMETISYQPKTEEGKHQLSTVMMPFTKANEIVSEWGDTEEEKARNRVILNAVLIGLPVIKKGGTAYIDFLKKGGEKGLLPLTPDDLAIYQESVKFKEEMSTQFETQKKGLTDIIDTIKNDPIMKEEHPAVGVVMDYLKETSSSVGPVAAMDHLRDTHAWEVVDDITKQIVEDAIDKVINPEKPFNLEEITAKVEANQEAGVPSLEGIHEQAAVQFMEEMKSRKDRSDKLHLEFIRDRLRDSEPPARSGVGAETKTVGGYPEWFRDKGYTRKEVQDIINKSLSGKKLADKQSEILDDLIQSSKEEYESVGEIIKETDRITGMKNEITDAERVADELPPIVKPATKKLTISETEGIELIGSDKFTIRTAESIAEKPRVTSDAEQVALGILKVKNQKDYLDINSKISEAKQADDFVGAGELTKERDILEKDRDTIDRALKASGTEWGRSGRVRQEGINEDYSLVAIISRAKADSLTGDITEGQRAEYTKYAEDIAKAKVELDKINEEIAQKQAQKSVEKIQVESVRRQVREKRTFAKGELDTEFDFLSKELDSILSASQLNMGFDPKAIAVFGKMARNRIEKGIIKIEEIVTDIHNKLKDKYGDITERDIRDAITRYGKTIQLSKEQIEVQLREAKSQGRLLSALEDAQAGERPLKSGLQRDKQSDRVRELQRQVHEEMKKSGLDKEITKTPEEQWKSSLDAIKTRFEHSIADTTRQIIDRKKITPKEGVKYDTEAIALHDLNNLFKDALETIVGKSEKSAERKIAEVEARLEKSIVEYDRKIQTRDIEAKKQTEITSPKIKELQTVRDGFKRQYDEIKRELIGKKNKSPEEIALNKKKVAVEKSIADYEGRIINDTKKVKAEKVKIENTELKELTKYRDALKQTYKEMQDALKPKLSADELANKRFKTYAENRIKKLEEMIASSDFAKKEKKEVPYNKESLDARFKLDKAIRAYNEAKFKDQMEHRTTMQKLGGMTMETINLSRAIKTSFDVSAVLRQGAFIVFGHPIRGIKNLPDMFKALMSEKERFRIDQEILNDPEYSSANKSGLYLAEHETKLINMEEVYMSRWAEKIPGVAASERAYTTFLNVLRFDSFKIMKKNLSTGTPLELKTIGNYINVATGRGNFGMKQNALVGMNTVFFAPRYVASRFQILLGQPLYRGSAATRIMIAKEYGRFLIGLGVVYTLGKFMGADIEIDPRSADFGKIKFGNVRVDPLAGLSQTTVLVERLLTGETKTISGKVVPIRGDKVPYGSGNSADVIARFLRSKLSPVVGTSVDILAGKDVVGQKVTAASLPDKLLTPLAFNDIFEAMQEQGVPAGAALGILSIFGMGLQSYNPAEIKRKRLEERFNSRNKNWASEIGDSMTIKKAVNE